MSLKKLEKEAQILSEIENQIFEVTKLQLHSGLEGFDSPDAYGIYRKTGGAPLGVVGSSFEPTQPKFLFDSFSSSVQDIPDADITKFRYSELKGGSRVKFTCPIGNVSFKNLKGLDDEMTLHLNLMTGFDGSCKTTMFISSYRMICKNGMKGFTTEFAIGYKNTKGNVAKASLMMDDVKRAMLLKEDFVQMIKDLNVRKITQKEQKEFIKKVTGIDPENKTLSTRKRNILDKINETVAIEIKDAGATAWALVNGITRYTNHVASKGSEDYLYVDYGMKLNSNAQQFALALLN